MGLLTILYEENGKIDFLKMTDDEFHKALQSIKKDSYLVLRHRPGFELYDSVNKKHNLRHERDYGVDSDIELDPEDFDLQGVSFEDIYKDLAIEYLGDHGVDTRTYTEFGLKQLIEKL